MKNLPIDLLMIIFFILDQSNRLECMAVCRQWRDIIHHYFLFRSIRIYSNKQLNRLIERASNDSIFGKKVERLTIEPPLPMSLDLKNLSTSFPNLLHFDLLSPNAYVFFPSEQAQLDQNHTWCECIETIAADGSEFITIMDFLSDVGKNLSQISVRGSKNLRFNFERLINAPALKILYLTNYDLSFHDLELLHETSLQLHTLSLQNVTVNNTILPLDIKPATSIKTLQFLNRSSSFNNKHLRYIGQKYTQVESLKIDLENVDFGAADAISEEQQKELVVSYLKKLGPRLRTLSLFMNLTNIKSMSSIFDLNVFNQCGVQIKTLDLDAGLNSFLFYQLEKFIIVNDTQSLSVHQAFKSPIHFRWLLKITGLKELTWRRSQRCINSFSKDVNVRDLIANLANTRLETLRLYDSYLLLNGMIEPMLYPWLKDITLSNTSLPAGIDTFISGSFPNLKRLKLESCLKFRNSFRLPSTDLCYLEIREKYYWSHYPIMLTTLRDNQSRFYKSRRKSYCIRSDEVIVRGGRYHLPSTHPVPLFYRNNIAKLRIVCKSVNNFIVDNIEVTMH